jgi:hypothetical protein
MLGLARAPTWWTSEYGTAPYKSTNTKLWTDLKNGYLRGENIYLSDYVRPDLLSIIPVDANGNLKNPNTFLVTANAYQDKKSKWKFGDRGPAEAAWRQSSHSRFSLLAAAALLNPCTFCSSLFDVSRTTINPIGQITYTEDEVRELLIKGLTHNDDKLCGSLVTVQKEIRTANFNVWFEENKKK